MLNCSILGMTNLFGQMEQIANALKAIRDNCLTQEEFEKACLIF